MDLYHMDSSPPCRAVRMVARHLNLSLNLIPVNVMGGEHMTPQFRKCADYDLARFPAVKEYYDRMKSTLPYFTEINELGMKQMKGMRNQNSK
ncbi:hypothetical protein HPB48_009834 [Haemaphysalis longicornis]|uniref:GST N-terminal domain-containing protein n=1 Tax=Haemaphysalis longicornis TaxID=44386 RepID=A0A9J6FZ38_HAELO|nr:hypothetical protein HPB48_009834 [Haemaphysalis longicornis]